MNITFTPLQEEHFSLLLKWLQAPHVKKWWDPEVLWTSALIQDKYGTYTHGYKFENGVKKPMQAYIICFNSIAIGYIQLYNAHDFPREEGRMLNELPNSLAAVDIFMGEQDYCGKGIGSLIMRQFLEAYVDPFFEYCFVDVDSANISAIRLYEKSGFEHMKAFKNIQWLVRKKP